MAMKRFDNMCKNFQNAIDSAYKVLERENYMTNQLKEKIYNNGGIRNIIM